MCSGVTAETICEYLFLQIRCATLRNHWIRLLLIAGLLKNCHLATLYWIWLDSNMNRSEIYSQYGLVQSPFNTFCDIHGNMCVIFICKTFHFKLSFISFLPLPNADVRKYFWCYKEKETQGKHFHRADEDPSILLPFSLIPYWLVTLLLYPSHLWVLASSQTGVGRRCGILSQQLAAKSLLISQADLTDRKNTADTTRIFKDANYIPFIVST